MPEDTTYCHTEIYYARNMEPVPVPVDIRDARKSNLPGWESCGFELMPFPSAVEDWTDEAIINDLHLDETTAFLKSLTGCAAVLFYPPLVRSRAGAARQADLAPIQFVHSDYTHGYRAMIENPEHPYHHILQPSMQRAGITAADIQRASRVLTLQCWRNIGPPDMDYPLCFCDARTVAEEALSAIRVAEYGGVKTEFDSFVSQPPENGVHAWYTYPEMSVDEVVVFRAFDSERVASGEPFWTLHTAFRDPTRADDAPGRESIETRGVCLFF